MDDNHLYPSLYGPNHGSPYYERIHMEWHEKLHERNSLSWWRVLFTREYDRLHERVVELTATLSFLDRNPWIVEYADG